MQASGSSGKEHQRVPHVAVVSELEVHVWTGRVAGHATQPDLLLRADDLSRPDVDAAEMPVDGLVAAPVIDHDRIAVCIAGRAREGDRAGARCEEGLSDTASDVCTVMKTVAP